MLERMANEGKINLSKFKIIGPYKSDHFPFKHSTRLYPEWPLASFTHTQDNLADKVAVELLKMTSNDPAATAGKYVGWTVPLNYQSVHKMLKDLKVGPYSGFGQVTMIEAIRQHLASALSVVVVMIMALFWSWSLKNEVKQRKRSEKKLQKSEQRFSLAMQGSNDGLWDWDLETDEVYFSPRWKDMLGYERDEIRGHPDEWKSLLHPEDREQALQAVDDCLKGRMDRYEIEFRMRHKGGDFIPILSRGFMLYNETNEPVRFVGTHVDITDIKQSEYNLKQSQTRLQLALDAAAAGVWIWEIKTGVVFWDKRMQEIFGLEPGSFNGSFEEWKACVHPDDIDAANAATLRALEHRDHYEHEYRVRGLDGGWRYINAQAEVILDGQGQPIRMVGMTTDITRRKRVEKELNASKRRSRAWLENSPACTKIVDLDLNLQYMSNAGVIGLGIGDVRTLYGKPYPFDFYPESFKKTMVNNLEKAIETGEVIEQEAAVVDVEGGELWFHSTIVPVTDDDGKIDYIIVVSIEITKRKQLESRIRQSQKLEAIGTLAGGVAHDFNNILGIISGNAELASLGVSDTQDATKNILEASKRGAELVKQLLAIGRRTQTAKKLLDPEIMIDEVLKLMRSTLPSSIEIRESIKGQGNKIFMDPTHLHQVLINLCSNAGQAMGEDGGMLEVTLEPITLSQEEAIPINASPGDYLQLMVRDTGPGISEEVQEHIFEPFFTTKEQGKGTGLGLSVVLSSLRECGGAIQVKSTLGKGSKFIVHLPIAEIPLEAQTDAGSNNTIEKGSGRILFVDDEPGLVNVGVEMLKALGYSAIGATDPQAAVKIFMESPGSFDAVVTDQVMPGLAGNDLATRILEVRPDIPIFLCTGFSEKITEENAAKVGFRGFFLKPVSIGDLSKALKEALHPQ
jgi:PAS domain S-box-containing protein